MEQAFQIIDNADIRFPLLAKPYYTDGRQGSHGLALVEDIEGLRQLVRGTGPPGIALPVMLQPFIEHGGCLFKVQHVFAIAGLGCHVPFVESILSFGSVIAFQVHCHSAICPCYTCHCNLRSRVQNRVLTGWWRRFPQTGR